MGLPLINWVYIDLSTFITHSVFLNPNSRKMKFYHPVLIFILGCLAAISPLSIDIYLPGFINIAKDFATTVDRVSSSLSAFLIGVAVCQLFYGPLLDKFGRKPPLVAGLIFYCLTSIGCMISQNLNMFIFFRFLQAVGCCVAMVAPTAIIRDVFPVKENAKVLSMMVLILGVSPIFAPTIGSFVLTVSSWRVLFAIMGGFGLSALTAVMFIFKESKSPDKTVLLNPGKIVQTYIQIFKNQRFYPFALAAAFASGGFFSYLAGSPFVLMKIFAVGQKNFGILFGSIAFGLILCSQLNNLLLKKYASERILKAALLVQTIIGLLLFVLSNFHYQNLYSFFVLTFLFVGCLGFIFSNATALSIAPFEKEAGSASALLGSLQMGAGALVSSILSVISNGTTKPMILLMVISAGIACLIIFSAKKDVIPKID